MNPQLNKVFSKLAKEENKTELASEKVELALADDLKKYVEVATRANKNIDSEAKSVKKLQSEIRTALAKVNATKNALKDISSDAKNDISKFEKMAKDLGINADKSKEYVAAKKSIKDIADSLKKAEQVYKDGQKNFI